MGFRYVFSTSTKTPAFLDVVCTEPQRLTVQPHANGIFDVKWSPSDTLLATASGDHSIRITTLSSSVLSQERTLHTLRGHEGTVKAVAWDPSHDGAVLCTGGRDGGICLWDLRVGEHSAEGGMAPVLSIPKAHDLERKTARPRGSRGKVVAGTPLPGITHLLYTDTHPHGIVSSCSSDGYAVSTTCPKSFSHIDAAV